MTLGYDRSAPARPSAPREDHVVRLGHASWNDYRRVLRMRGEQSAPRVAYADGVVEIVSPSLDHEAIKSNLGCLVEAWMDVHGIEYRVLGSWTLDDESLQRAAEPDESYAIGADLDDPGRPDLVVEVVWTHRGFDRLAVYAARAVPEVWTYERGAIRVQVLRDGVYVDSAVSEVLPGIDLPRLAAFLDRPSTSAARREYLATLGR